MAGMKDKVAEKSLQVVVAAKDKGEIVADVAKDGVAAIAEKAHEVSHDIRMRIYRPVSLEQFEADDFRPRMIVLADDAKHKGNDLFEGAVGWLDEKAGIDVFHMYQSFEAGSGLSFTPYPDQGVAYLPHPLDRNRYIGVAEYVGLLRDERVAELQRIAHDLAVKSYRIEFWQEKRSMAQGEGESGLKVKQKVSPRGKDKPLAEGAAEASYEETRYMEYSVLHEGSFEGEAEPREPELHWFKGDKQIETLISSRCAGDGRNISKRYKCIVKGASVFGMSADAAGKVDAALKGLKINCAVAFKGAVINESRHTICLDLEF